MEENNEKINPKNKWLGKYAKYMIGDKDRDLSQMEIHVFKIMIKEEEGFKGPIGKLQQKCDTSYAFQNYKNISKETLCVFNLGMLLMMDGVYVSFSQAERILEKIEKYQAKQNRNSREK